MYEKKLNHVEDIILEDKSRISIYQVIHHIDGKGWIMGRDYKMFLHKPYKYDDSYEFCMNVDKFKYDEVKNDLKLKKISDFISAYEFFKSKGQWLNNMYKLSNGALTCTYTFQTSGMAICIHKGGFTE